MDFNRSELHYLIAECFRYFKEMHENDAVSKRIVANSIPILFFGDLNGYLASSLRIVTVGINPSDAEFPKDRTRFSRAHSLYGTKDEINDAAIEDYITALSEYFDLAGNTYSRKTDNAYEWFYRKPICGLLSGLDASYDHTRKNRVLHTDICTPIPTSPTWSGLNKIETETMRKKGNELWEKLIRLLKPDVILLSCADKYWKDLEGFSGFISRSCFNNYEEYANACENVLMEYDTTKNGKKRKKGKLVMHRYCYCFDKKNPKDCAYVYIDSDPNVTPFTSFGEKRAKECGEKILDEQIRIRRK